MHWRWIFLVYAIPGIVWSVWFYVWFRDRPEDHASVNDEELTLIRGDLPPLTLEKERRTPTPWLVIFSSAAMWWLCAQQFFKAAGYVFYQTWFATYLQETRQVSLEDVGPLTSLPHVALTISPIIGGWFSDWLLVRSGSRRVARQWLSAVTLMGCGGLVLLAYSIADPWLAVSVISVGAFCSGLSGPCAYAATIEMGGRHIAPVFSTMNMAGNVGAILFPIVTPYLVELTGSWDGVLVLFAGMYVAAGLCWLPFNPNGQIIEKDTP
jgi:nitrate/nitrite transporter NarK